LFQKNRKYTKNTFSCTKSSTAELANLSFTSEFFQQDIRQAVWFQC